MQTGNIELSSDKYLYNVAPTTWIYSWSVDIVYTAGISYTGKRLVDTSIHGSPVPQNAVIAMADITKVGRTYQCNYYAPQKWLNIPHHSSCTCKCHLITLQLWMWASCTYMHLFWLRSHSVSRARPIINLRVSFNQCYLVMCMGIVHTIIDQTEPCEVWLHIIV